MSIAFGRHVCVHMYCEVNYNTVEAYEYIAILYILIYFQRESDGELAVAIATERIESLSV